MKETASDSRRRSAFVTLFLAVALVSSAPAATASTHLRLDARDASSLTVPGDNFFPESIAATPAGTLFVGSVVTGEILRFRPGATNARSNTAAESAGSSRPWSGGSTPPPQHS